MCAIPIEKRSSQSTALHSYRRILVRQSNGTNRGIDEQIRTRNYSEVRQQNACGVIVQHNIAIVQPDESHAVSVYICTNLLINNHVYTVCLNKNENRPPIRSQRMRSCIDSSCRESSTVRDFAKTTTTISFAQTILPGSAKPSQLV